MTILYDKYMDELVEMEGAEAYWLLSKDKIRRYTYCGIRVE